MLDKLKEFATTRNMIIALVAVLLLVVGYYTYVTYVTPKINPAYVENSEFMEKGPPKEVELFFFFTEWCPHCKAAKPEWNKLKTEYESKGINNTTIIFREIDCDKEEKIADEYGVEGYPTIKLIKGNEVVEYNAKPEYDTLVEFLHTTL